MRRPRRPVIGGWQDELERLRGQFEDTTTRLVRGKIETLPRRRHLARLLGGARRMAPVKAASMRVDARHAMIARQRSTLEDATTRLQGRHDAMTARLQHDIQRVRDAITALSTRRATASAQSTRANERDRAMITRLRTAIERRERRRHALLARFENKTLRLDRLRDQVAALDRARDTALSSLSSQRLVVAENTHEAQVAAVRQAFERMRDAERAMVMRQEDAAARRITGRRQVLDRLDENDARLHRGLDARVKALDTVNARYAALGTRLRSMDDSLRRGEVVTAEYVRRLKPGVAAYDALMERTRDQLESMRGDIDDAFVDRRLGRVLGQRAGRLSRFVRAGTRKVFHRTIKPSRGLKRLHGSVPKGKLLQALRAQQVLTGPLKPMESMILFLAGTERKPRKQKLILHA